MIVKEDNNALTDSEKKALMDALGKHLSKSKSELVSDIEKQLSVSLGMDVRQAFDEVAVTQQIRGGGMNLDRAHKSMLVLLAYVLAQGRS
jgi:hypothetical protein